MPKWKRFIQGANLNEELQPSTSQSGASISTSQLEGNEAKEIYDAIISEPSTAQVVAAGPSRSTRSSYSTSHHHHESISTKSPRKSFLQLLKDVELNNCEVFKDYIIHHPDTDLNNTDQYGWTLLMTAAVSNSTEITQFLLESGADWTLVEKSGLSAYQLAKKYRRTRICELITTWVEETYEVRRAGDIETIDISSDEEPEAEYFCESCGVSVKNKSNHLKSIAHLVSSNESGNSSRPHYGIPESNRGFQLMLKTGWDRGGLGLTGEGLKYPVKTVLKRNRAGIGSEKIKKVSKVTHFQPFDTAAINKEDRIQKDQTIQKSESQRRERKERQKERDFRRDFYDPN